MLTDRPFVLPILPEGPGCAFTEFEEAPSSAPINVRGTIDAGPTIALENASDALALTRTTDADAVTYSLADCAALFPFGATFDVYAEGSTLEGGIAGFRLPEAVAVGPDLLRTLPADADLQDGALWHSQQDPLTLAWEYPQAAPVTSEGPATELVTVVVQSSWVAENRIYQTLGCHPEEDGTITIPAEDLALLTRDDGSGALHMLVSVDTLWVGREVSAPWGELVKVNSSINLSGDLELTE